MNRRQRRAAAIGGRPNDRMRNAASKLRNDQASALNKARQLLRAGRLTEGENACRRALALDPNNGHALHLLGCIKGNAGDLASARQLFERACSVMPNEPVFHVDLGHALVRSGCNSAAVEAYERALTFDPNLTAAQMGLGNVLRDQRQFAEAEAAYRKVIALAPALAEGHANLGFVLKEQERSDEAIAAFEQAIRLNPLAPRAHSSLGILLWRQGRTEEAMRAFERALKVEPGFVDVHAIIGNLLLEEERGLVAEAPFRALLAHRPDDPRVHEGLGRALDLQGRFQEAEQSFRLAIALDPRRAGGHHALISNLAQQNKLDEAHAVCRDAIAADIEPSSMLVRRSELYMQAGKSQRALAMARKARDADTSGSAGLWQLVMAAKVRSGDEVLAQLESLNEQIGDLSPLAACRIKFALAKAYDDLGDHDRAFDALKAGNRLKRDTVGFDVAKAEAELRDTAAVFDKELIGRLAGSGDSSRRPVFIIGMPRSGTTLTEQILSSHPSVHGAGELKDFSIALAVLDDPAAPPKSTAAMGKSLTSELCHQIGRRYVDVLSKRSNRALRMTDKMPLNFTRLGLIHLALPQATIIHCRRNPVDTCLSCFQQLFNSGNRFAYDLTELGRYYRAYLELMDHWHRTLPAGRILEVRYENLVANLEAEARRLVAHCGLPWDDACLAFHRAERQVRTASLTQVRRPIYQTSVEKWRRYEMHLSPLLEALGDAIDRYRTN